MMVEASCRTKLTTDHWKITAPEAGTMNSLRIEFERPLGHALALKYIFIRESLGEVLEGEAVLVEGDRIWMFTPYKPWSAGRYTMTISPLLEDAAGNNFNNPFDIDLSVSERINSDEPLTMEFVVSKASN